jgi:hypothetical protein
MFPYTYSSIIQSLIDSMLCRPTVLKLSIFMNRLHAVRACFLLTRGCPVCSVFIVYLSDLDFLAPCKVRILVFGESQEQVSMTGVWLKRFAC